MAKKKRARKSRARKSTSGTRTYHSKTGTYKLTKVASRVGSRTHRKAKSRRKGKSKKR